MHNRNKHNHFQHATKQLCSRALRFPSHSAHSVRRNTQIVRMAFSFKFESYSFISFWRFLLFCDLKWQHKMDALKHKKTKTKNISREQFSNSHPREMIPIKIARNHSSGMSSKRRWGWAAKAITKASSGAFTGIDRLWASYPVVVLAGVPVQLMESHLCVQLVRVRLATKQRQQK